MPKIKPEEVNERARRIWDTNAAFWNKHHPYFHRPLYVILQLLFKNRFILDGFEECAFPPDYKGGTYPFSWSGNYSEIPPVLVARSRLK